MYDLLHDQKDQMQIVQLFDPNKSTFLYHKTCTLTKIPKA